MVHFIDDNVRFLTIGFSLLYFASMKIQILVTSQSQCGNPISRYQQKFICTRGSRSKR